MHAIQVAGSGPQSPARQEAKFGAALALGMLHPAWEAATSLQHPNCWRRLAQAAAHRFDVPLAIKCAACSPQLPVHCSCLYSLGSLHHILSADSY